MGGFQGYCFQTTIDSTTTKIGGITDYGLPLGQEMMADPVGGSPFAQHKAINKQRPRINLTSHDAATIFGLCLPIGLGLESGDTVAFFEQALDDFGVGKSGSNHRKHSASAGNLLCRKLSCDHQGDLACELEFLPRYDGTNSIIVTAEGQALPTLPGDPARFGLGPITLGGVVIPQVTKVEIDLGLAADSLGSGGNIWDDEFELTKVVPIITITSRAVNLFAGTGGIALKGKLGAHSNTKIYFRKREKGLAGYIANGTAEHLSITADGTVYVDDGHKSSGTKRAEMVIKMVCGFDGTNNPIVPNAATAIT